MHNAALESGGGGLGAGVVASSGVAVVVMRWISGVDAVAVVGGIWAEQAVASTDRPPTRVSRHPRHVACPCLGVG